MYLVVVGYVLVTISAALLSYGVVMHSNKWVLIGIVGIVVGVLAARTWELLRFLTELLGSF